MSWDQRTPSHSKQKEGKRERSCSPITFLFHGPSWASPCVRQLSGAMGLGWRPRKLWPNVLVWTDTWKRWIIIQESSRRACNYLITSYFGRWISEGGTHKALTLFALGSCIIAVKVGNKIHKEQHRKRSVEAWCFNSCRAQEKEGEGVSPAGQASMSNLVKNIPADLRLIRSMNGWTNSASFPVPHVWIPSCTREAKYKWNLHVSSFPHGSRCWTETEVTLQPRCREGAIRACPIFSQEICRNLLAPLTKHSTTLDQRCSLTGARHRSVWTMYSWALVEAMPSGEDSRLRLSAPNTCWFPCVHWQERTCRILVLQDSPNTVLDVLRASAHFKGASEIHNLTYTWEGKNNCLSYRWENDTEKINIKTKDLMAEWEQVPR